MAEFRHVHCTFCHQTFVSASYEECALCRKSGGLVDPGSPEAMRDVVQVKQAEGGGLWRSPKLSSDPAWSRRSRRVVIGVVMMGAVAWFFGALAVGWVYYYPPILFAAGAGMVVRGLTEPAD